MFPGYSRQEWEDAMGKNGEEGRLRHQKRLGMHLFVVAVGLAFLACCAICTLIAIALR